MEARRCGERERGRLPVLHELAPVKDGGAQISPLWVLSLRISKWGATVDGRPPVLHELASEKDGGAQISPLQVSPLRISEWGAPVNGGAAHPRRARGQGHDMGGAWVGREGHARLGQRHGVCGGRGADRAKAHRV
jgi:hypothetical protein